MIFFDERQLEENNLVAIVNRWCPKGAEDEPVEQRLLRGLANANACVNDLRRVLCGESPIRLPNIWPDEAICPVVKKVKMKIIWHGKPCPQEHLAQVEADLAGMLGKMLDNPQQLISHTISLDNNAFVTAWGEPGDDCKRRSNSAPAGRPKSESPEVVFLLIGCMRRPR